MTEDMAKGYDPALVEKKWYDYWLEKGFFHADENNEDKEPFTIVIPLPNVTGYLHIGHALMTSIQDLLIRWKRMAGYNALWMPGTDHAGIATQMVVERDLWLKEKKTRYDIGREKFLARAWEWKEQKGGRIFEQIKEMGASLDWDRARFTMDEVCSRAVREAFVRLYKEGLIYRGYRMVNLSPRLQTIVSDLEVEHEENVKGELWSFAYPLTGTDGEIVVATTRPETMLGDTAVAVHPDDPRYRHLIGSKVKHPILGYELPIIGDAELVDPEFGTGAVKVTPAHDINDFETGLRHNLKLINLLNMDGTLNENAGPYEGLDCLEARARVKEDLSEKGLYRGTEEHLMAIGRCQRSGGIIEPFLSEQWFIKIKPMAEPAIKAVEEGNIVFIPKNWEKTYYEWMENIRDWCISRQLWWGHRIPAWHCDVCGHVTVSVSDPDRCEKCSDKNIRQDDDVLDTWFSSALWPFSTMSWPENTKTLEKFYPTSVMETGFDIIFFWVARMIMMGLHFMKDVPFHTVFLHAMVLDHEGQKMSKVKGNVIDPLDIIHGISLEDLLAKRYEDGRSVGLKEKQLKAIEKATRKEFSNGIPASGADALRFALLSMAGHGRDIRLDTSRIEGFRFFANKIWNASRFALMNLADFDPQMPVETRGLSLSEKWILFRLREASIGVNRFLEGYHFDQAAMMIYHFFWDEFCDWYIELCKPTLYGKDQRGSEARHAVQHTLVRCLDQSLKLLHPFMPFITEEIWQKIPKGEEEPDSIMVSQYPEPHDFADAEGYGNDAETMGQLMELIKALRNIRGEIGIAPGRRIPLIILAHDKRIADLVDREARLVQDLARVESIQMVDEFRGKGPAATGVCPGAELFVPLGGLLNVEEERSRIRGQLDKVTEALEKAENKLDNQGFVRGAPDHVVAEMRERRQKLQFKAEKLAKSLDMLNES
jgi:valyl-tRNA synthetase